MGSPERQTAISDAVTAAVAAFCAARQPEQLDVRRRGKPDTLSAASAKPRR
jgi:hypothetical protein